MTPLWIFTGVLAITVAGLLLLYAAIAARLRVITHAIADLSRQSVGMRAGPTIGALRDEELLPPDVLSALVQSGDGTERLSYQVLIAYFHATCQACREHMQGLADLVARGSLGPLSAITVIVGDEAVAADLRLAASAFAVVVTQPDGGPLVRACRIEMYPTFILADGRRRVIATAHSPGTLEVRAASASAARRPG